MNNTPMILFLFIFCKSIYSCNIPNTLSNNQNIDTAVLCDSNGILKSIKDDKITIIENNFSKLIIENNDSCVLLFLDVIFNNYINHSTERGYKIISSLSCHFDGYISEYVILKFDKIFASENLTELFLSDLFKEYKERKPQTLCLKEMTELYIQVYNPEVFDKINLNKKTNDYLNFIHQLKNNQ